MIIGALVMFNPVWLNTFVTLVNTEHFTKTAEKLFMTQPGVSQHINKLENAFGYSLIRRDKKSFEITVIAIGFASPVPLILESGCSQT